MDNGNNKDEFGPLQIRCTLSNYKSMANSLRLIFDTQEFLNPDLLAQILSNHNQLGWLFFGVKQIESEMIISAPDIKVEVDEKSPAKRMRDRMYVYYTKVRQPNGEGFESWYREAVDGIGQKYLDAIPDE